MAIALEITLKITIALEIAKVMTMVHALYWNRNISVFELIPQMTNKLMPELLAGLPITWQKVHGR